MSTGTGASILGHPLAAVAWLAAAVRDHGRPLRAGEVVLSGSLGPMVTVAPGDAFQADISGVGQVSAVFAERNLMTGKTKAAVIGSGNIGTDLMIKMLRLGRRLEVAAMVGIDPASDGLARARRLGVPTTADGVDGLIGLPGFEDIGIVFDATSAKAHEANARALAPYGTRMIDLTPAALGPFVVPAVNLEQHVDAPDLNMVTCGGQATIPIVAAVARVTPVPYAEIVASIASKSAGPGHPRQHRRVHRDHRQRDRVGRRRRAAARR